MKQINWQDSLERAVVEEKRHPDRRLNVAQQNSYVDEFKQKTSAGRERSNGFHQSSGMSYKDLYQKGASRHRVPPLPHVEPAAGNQTFSQRAATSGEECVEDKNTSQSTSSEKLNKQPPPTFAFNNTNRSDDRKASAGWKFLNLKNKKQTGDLYKKILFYKKKNDNKVFNFSGSRGTEGVTTILSNLVAYINGRTAEKKILVIDANLRSPRLHHVFRINGNAPGMQDVFNNNVQIRNAIFPVTSSVFVLCSGNGRNKGSASLDQDNLVKLLEYCRQYFDFIFIDGPSILSSPDALSVASAVDVNFLVIQSAKDQRPVIEKTKSLLQNDECSLGGVVLNRMAQVIPGWLYKFI